MAEQDTIRLLRECDAGVKMGIASIEDVVERVKDPALRRMLVNSRSEHQKLERQIEAQLERNREEGKDPNPMARSMSWIKTNMKLNLEESDRTIAGLMTDGCDMGVKSLTRYRNEYEAADEAARNIAGDLIGIEQKLEEGLRPYL